VFIALCSPISGYLRANNEHDIDAMLRPLMKAPS
jgi:hypothetical protein